MSPQSRHKVYVFWRTVAAIALLIAIQGATQEVTLTLRNGDRITGFIRSENTNAVVLTNVWSSGITIPLSAIQRRELLATAPTQGTNVASSAGALPNPPTNAVVVKPAPLVWSGEVQVGADLGFSEKNRQLYTGRAKVGLSYYRLRNLFDYSFSYGRTDGIVSANRMDASMKTDYELSPRVYAYNLIGSGYDEIRKINFRYEAGPGLGYHVVKGPRFLFKTEAGVNYQAQYLADDTKSELVFYRLAEEAAWKITPRLSLDEKFEFFPQVDDFGQFRFRFESNARYALMNNLFFTVTVLDQYDTQPASGIGPNDLQVRSTIGVKF